MNYIDIKVTVWNRIHFQDGTEMKNLVDIINEQGLDAVIDDDLGFTECECLYDTEERISVADNIGSSTVEVYQDRQLLWENAKH